MQLVIEITRKCNQNCDHCLRGCSQNLNIDNKYITSMLEQIKALNLSYDVTFSGGEPTLNLDAIRHYITECNRLNMNHNCFYIATNGQDLSVDFAGLCLQLYGMADDKELSAVELSNDDQHDYIPEIDKQVMKGLSFFRDKHEGGGYNHFDRGNYGILQGNYAEYSSDGRELKIEEFDYEDFENSFNDHTIYLNCKGNIINGCDWSYYSQDEREDIQICGVNNFTAWYNESMKEVEVYT